MTKTYHFVSDENIYIKFSQVETFDNDEWLRNYTLLENQVKEMQNQNVSAPKVETQPVAQPAAEQPAPEQKQDEIFVATFEVTGTSAELTKLKNFLIENNFNYKNL